MWDIASFYSKSLKHSATFSLYSAYYNYINSSQSQSLTKCHNLGSNYPKSVGLTPVTRSVSDFVFKRVYQIRKHDILDKVI